MKIKIRHGGARTRIDWKQWDKALVEAYKPVIRETIAASLDFSHAMALSQIESDPLRRRSLKKLRGVHRKQEAAVRQLLGIIRSRSQHVEAP